MFRDIVLSHLFLVMGFAQTLQFEAVSIQSVPRPTPSATTPVTFNVSGNHLEISNYRLIDLLTAAFRVQPPQVDAPSFARDEFFDVRATLPAGATREQVPEMLRTVLVERFKLNYHIESRNYQITVLTVGNSGMKLPRVPDGTRSAFESRKLADGTTQSTHIGRVTSLFPVMNSFGGLQLVDETGLDGMYTWVNSMPPPVAGKSYRDGLRESFKVMIEAAGLLQENRNVSKDTIVVDHLEKQPTDN